MRQAVSEEVYKERFFKKVNKTKGCWEWIGAKTSSGYGNFIYKSKNKVAHRVSYEWIKGPVPKGLDLDHLCRNRACVNPDHLEPVTRSENLLRGDTIPAAHAAKTYCPKGHEYNDENTYYDKGSRFCRECRRSYMKEYNRKRKEASE